jgi:hypothetical protein
LTYWVDHALPLPDTPVAQAPTIIRNASWLVASTATSHAASSTSLPETDATRRTCGILGCGGVGIAAARLMRCLGMRIYAINRRGASEETVDWDRHAGPPGRTAPGFRCAGRRRVFDACDRRDDRDARAVLDEAAGHPDQYCAARSSTRRRCWIIVEIGTYPDLCRRHPNVPVIGSGNEVMLPGLVDGHHHIGLMPVQLGSPDMPLELWFVTRMVMRNVNLYLDTLYSAFEMIASGIARSSIYINPKPLARRQSCVPNASRMVRT